MANSTGGNCSGTITDSGSNFTDDATCGTIPATLTGLDPMLQDNGGPTLTHALLTGSVAIDAVACGLATDQRGAARSDGLCDSGSYEFGDSDADGVLDNDDLCPGTAIPEGVPTRRLGVNRFALVDGDGVFDTTPPRGRGRGPGLSFTTADTGGCSCEQIIEVLALGKGHKKFGCSISAMETWVGLVP